MNRMIPLSVALFFALICVASATEQPGPGDAAPDFELSDQQGNLHSIEDYRGQWVALYFYPKDDTPGCTTEACEFRDNVFAFRDANCQILGVSLDDVSSHRAFADKYGLPFPLLADVTGVAASAYGVKSRLFGLTLAKRETFLIDPDGNVARHYQTVDPDKHSEQILSDLQTLQIHQRESVQGFDAAVESAHGKRKHAVIQ